MEYVQHADSETEQTTSEGRNPTEDIMKAVRAELSSNRMQIINEVKEQALPELEAAVKRAMEGAGTSGKEKKRTQHRQHAFKNRGNKRRYEKNEDVSEAIEDAMEAIGKKKLDDAKLALEKGMKVMKTQQKLIKMADREEHGWEVVRYYVSDDLASDSDDEKAINRARREALASIKKRKTKSGEGNEKFRNAGQSRNGREFGNADKKTNPTYGSYGPADRRGGRICYYCGIEGHMQYSCPKRYTRN